MGAVGGKLSHENIQEESPKKFHARIIVLKTSSLVLIHQSLEVKFFRDLYKADLEAIYLTTRHNDKISSVIPAFKYFIFH